MFGNLGFLVNSSARVQQSRASRAKPAEQSFERDIQVRSEESPAGGEYGRHRSGRQEEASVPERHRSRESSGEPQHQSKRQGTLV